MAYDTMRTPRPGKVWHLELECGHNVERPVKRRGGGEDPAPKWSYCAECAEGEGRGPKRTVVGVDRP